jgi:hypothetical protein
MSEVDKALDRIQQRAEKFIAKVESGRAVSKETYADMLVTVEDIAALRAALAAPQENAKWCSHCKTDSHDDAECWSTRIVPDAPQEPVAWEITRPHAEKWFTDNKGFAEASRNAGSTVRPLVYADAAPTAQEGKQSPHFPDVLFDGYAVLNALSDRAKQRTSAENVPDVLDAVVRLMKEGKP